MIPKKIHYCWFGGKSIPKDARKCIASWRRFFPDYEIVEWNEANFDVNVIPYTAEAYRAGKYAFVSDYARLWIMYKEGGIYFDTDVEVIKDMSHIVSAGSYMGCEAISDKKVGVNPGLGFACEPTNAIVGEILDSYIGRKFIVDGKINTTTIVDYTTNVLSKHGFKRVDKLQAIGDLTIYPNDFFNPKSFATGKISITSNTYSIHHFNGSWHVFSDKIKIALAQRFGSKFMIFMSRIKRKILKK